MMISWSHEYDDIVVTSLWQWGDIITLQVFPDPFGCIMLVGLNEESFCVVLFD